MPPVFGPGVALADPLEVLRRRQRHHAAPVGQREDRHLLAHEQLLDHDRAREGGGRAQTLVELLHRLADEDALPRRQPVDLDDARRASDGERLGRRNAGRSQDGLREALRALDPRGRAAGAEDGDPVPAQDVGDTGDERRLRADHDEIDVEAAREAEQALAVLGPHRVTVAEPRDPGVAGSSMERAEARCLRELPCERVLAPARPDQEHLHGGRVYSPRSTAALGGHGGDPGERLDHVRVELRPRAAAELLERLLGGAPGAVGPVGRDRAVRVAAADDPRDERDLLADEPVGVAAAAEALVAGADEAARRSRARRRPGRASPRRRPCASRRSHAPRA